MADNDVGSPMEADDDIFGGDTPPEDELNPGVQVGAAPDKVSDEVELQLVPDERYLKLFYDHFDEGRPKLFHTGTGEMVDLHELVHTGAMLCFDQGNAFIDPASDAQDALWCCDLLSKEMYTSPDGRVMFVSDVGMAVSAGRDVHRLWADDLAREHDLLVCSVQNGPCRSEAAHRVAVFRSARWSCKFFWSATDIHMCCKLQAYGDKGGAKWVHNYLCRWDAELASMGFPLGILRSMQYGTDEPNDDGLAWKSRCLPFVSLPTACLICRLGILAFASHPAKGRARSQPDVDSLRCYLKALLTGAGGSPWSLHIFGSSFRSPDTFRPWVGVLPEPTTTLRVAGTGEVDIGPLVAVSVQNAEPFFRDFSKEVEKTAIRLTGTTSFLCLWDLFGVACSFHKAKNYAAQAGSLLLQLAWQLGRRMEHNLAPGGSSRTGLGVQVGQLRCCPQKLSLDRACVERDRLLIGYWHAGLLTVGAHASQGSSTVFDFSRVGGRNVMVSATIAHDNSAVYHPVQVLHEYVSEATLLNASGQNFMPVGPTRRDWRKRARAWLGRSKEQAWRPRKKARVKSFQALRVLDHALQVSLGCDGLLTWRYRSNAPPLERPFHTLVGDSGPENFAMVQFMQRHMRLCIDFFPDPSHAVHRDFIAGLKGCGLWPHTLMSMLAFNARHGPWHSDLRLWQVHDAMLEYFELESHEGCPLYQAYLPGLLRDRRHEDLVDSTTSATIWEDLKQMRIWELKGSHTNLNRFLGFVRESRREDRHWWARAHAQTYACIALDLFRGQQFQSLLEKTPKMQELKSAEEKRSMKEESAEEAKLRKSCQNMMVFSTMIYSDADAHRRQRVLLTVGQPWEEWHGKQNTELRTAAASLTWLKREIQSRFAETAQRTFATLRDEVALHEVGFELCVHGMPDNADLQALLDDETASTMAAFAMELNGARLRRHMFMLRGWPALSVMLLDDSEAPFYLGMLKADYEGFLEVQACRTAAAKRVCSRSVFKLALVEMLVDALRSNDWVMSAEIRLFLTKFHQRALGSQLAEDGFRSLRECEKNFPNKKPPPATMYASLVQDRILGERHHFAEVGATGGFLKRNATLPRHAFEIPRRSDRDKAFAEVVGYGAPKWYSTTPRLHALQFLDLALVEQLRPQGRLDRLASLVCSLILDGHNLLLKKDGDDASSGWLFAFRRIQDTACLAWPAVKSPLDGSNTLFFEPDPSGSAKYIVVHDLSEWVAYEYEWASPLSQWLHNPGCRSSASAWARIRARPTAVKLGSTDVVALPILELVAWRAFWSMDKASLLALARAVNMADHVRSDMSLFQIANNLVMAVLGLSEFDTLEVLAKRMAAMTPRHEHLHNEMLSVDEVSGMMDQDDERDMEAEKKSHQQRLVVKEEFVENLREARKRVRPPAPASRAAKGSAACKRQAGRAGRGKGGRAAQPAPLVWPADRLPSQSDAKAMCPPGGYIWRSLRSGGWQSHYPPYPRVSASWHLYGEREALARNLRSLWRNHCESQGLALANCPVEGLFSLASPGESSEVAGAAAP